MNKFKFRSISMFFMAIINVIISVFLAKAYGPIGAAIGTGISLILCNGIIMNIYYYCEIKLDVIKFWKSIINMTIKFIIPIIIIVPILYCTNLSNILDMILLIPLYCILYGIVCYLLVMNEYEKGIVKAVLLKIRGKKA